MTTALNGIKVIDLSRMAPGPFCTMVLGDLGADVLRSRGAGRRKDGARKGRGCERVGGPTPIGVQRTQPQQAQHRAEPEVSGRAGCSARPCEGCGCVRRGVQARRSSGRLGCDYETLSALNPRLVYCSLSGYGQDGPYSGLVGHDINYISVGGALGVIGSEDGPPVIPYNIVADYAGGGFHAATAILAAVLARGHTGRGQYVDVAMSDGVAYMLASLMSDYFTSGAVPQRGVMGLNGGAPYYNVYECQDGRYLSIGCIEPWFWQALCSALGREDLFAGQFDAERMEEVKRELRSIFLTRDRDEWWEMLSGIDNIAVAKVSTLDEVVQDPQNLHRRMVVEAGTVDGETVRQVGVGPKLSDTPGTVRSLGATVGQHTDDVLEGLGYSSERIASLRESGAVS